MLRGEISKGDPTRTEGVSFLGNHWVEAYIVDACPTPHAHPFEGLGADGVVAWRGPIFVRSHAGGSEASSSSSKMVQPLWRLYLRSPFMSLASFRETVSPRPTESEWVTPAPRR